MAHTFSAASPEVATLLDFMHDYMKSIGDRESLNNAMTQNYVLIQGVLAMQHDLFNMTAEQSKSYCEVLLADHLLNIGVGIDDSEIH